MSTDRHTEGIVKEPIRSVSVRLPEHLHRWVKEKAARDNRSFNRQVVKLLSDGLVRTESTGLAGATKEDHDGR